MNYYTLNKPIKTKQKLFAFLFAMSITIPIFFFVFWSVQKYYDHVKYQVLKNPVHIKGIVGGKSSFKGKGLKIEYFVDKEPYILKTSVSNEVYQKYDFGDEIDIIYNKLDPSQAILEE